MFQNITEIVRNDFNERTRMALSTSKKHYQHY